MIGLSILAVGLLSACQKDDVTTEKGGNADVAYATLQVKLGSESSPLSRAITANTKQDDAEGNTLEKKVNRLQFFNSSEYQLFDSNSNPKLTFSGGLYTLENPFKTTPGSREMAVGLNIIGTPQLPFTSGINPNDVDPNFMYETDSKFFTNVYSKLVSNDGLAMTSEVRSEVVQPKIESAQVGPGKNQFDFNVERVACKGIVVETKGGAEFKNGAYIKYGVTLDDLTYAPINGATTTYLFANHAGKRTLALDGTGYAGFKSAIADITSTNGDKFLDADKAFKDGLVRLGAMYKGDAEDKKW